MVYNGLCQGLLCSLDPAEGVGWLIIHSADALLFKDAEHLTAETTPTTHTHTHIHTSTPCTQTEGAAKKSRLLLKWVKSALWMLFISFCSTPVLKEFWINRDYFQQSKANGTLPTPKKSTREEKEKCCCLMLCSHCAPNFYPIHIEKNGEKLLCGTSMLLHRSNSMLL